MSGSYYNEIDPKAAAWLRELIAKGLIAPGEVDERSIEDVRPSELTGFTQCHFFAGIGGWSYALRLAGWPDDRSVWTGSCPCQPFSQAGQGRGTTDERHLWPAWHYLIEECRPGVVFGEQVASRDALAWWDLVHDDLEATDYACAAFDLCSAGVGAPHIRQRLHFVADRFGPGLEEQRQQSARDQLATSERGGPACDLADAEQHRSGYETPPTDHDRSETDRPANWAGGCRSAPRDLADVHGSGLGARGQGRQALGHGATPGAGSGVVDPWARYELIPCRDGKSRPVEPGSPPVAHGLLARVVRLRGYGNAINPHVAAEMIRAYMDVRG